MSFLRLYPYQIGNSLTDKTKDYWNIRDYWKVKSQNPRCEDENLITHENSPGVVPIEESGKSKVELTVKDRLCKGIIENSTRNGIQWDEQKECRKSCCTHNDKLKKKEKTSLRELSYMVLSIEDINKVMTKKLWHFLTLMWPPDFFIWNLFIIHIIYKGQWSR